MRVLIHALGATMGGAQRHLAGFLPALSTAGRNHAFRVIVRTGFEYVGSANVELCRIDDRSYTTGVARTWFDNINIPRLARHFRADAILSLLNLGPICPNVPHVIMERNALLFAKKYWKLFGPWEVMRFRLQRLLATACMRRAKVIITPSHYMACLIREECRSLPVKRFAVLPHAFTESGYQHELDRETVLRLDSRPGTKILYPCLAGPHKGIDLLLKIARAIPESLNANIFVTGGEEGGAVINESQRRAGELGVNKKLVFLGRIPQQQMSALYQACDLLLYVSPVESFGFPLLEALAFGLPIVAVDTPVNREVCGSAARYFSGGNPEMAARAIEEALRRIEDMRVASQKQFDSRDRTWDTYVRILLRILESEINTDHPNGE